MILDAIIALFGAIVEAAFVGFATLVNGIAAGIELIIGIFVSGFHLGRISREKKEASDTRRNANAARAMMVGLVVVLAWIFLVPRILNRRIAVVASDGYSVPYAAMIIRTGSTEQHKRTDNAGNIEIPRFGLPSLTVKDPRYVEQTWQNAELKDVLTVKRTILGAGLDKVAGMLLKPSGEHK